MNQSTPTYMAPTPSSPIKKILHSGWLVWAIAALFYCFNISLRIYPSIMSNQLVEHFALGSGALFGFLTSAFYYIYTPLQIPVGFLVDRFSLRHLIIMAIMVCLLGQFAFTMSNDFGVAMMARGLVGFGCAFAYIGTLKIASLWLHPNRFGIVTTATDAIGMMAGIGVDAGLTSYTSAYGYHATLWLIIISGVITLSLAILFIRRHPSRAKGVAVQSRLDLTLIKTRLSELLSNKQIWLIGLLGCLSYLPSTVFGDAWGPSYFVDIYHLSQKHAGWILSSFFAGWAIVGPFIGLASDFKYNRRMPILIALLVDVTLFSLVLFLPYLFGIYLGLYTLMFIFFLIGACVGSHPLCFALSKENFPLEYAGLTIGVTNFMVMTGGLIFQPMVGKVLDVMSHTFFHQTVTAYSLASYTAALSVIPICLVLSLIVLIFIKETGHKMRVLEKQVEAAEATS